MLKLDKSQALSRVNIANFENTQLAKMMDRLPPIGNAYGVWLAGGSVRRTLSGDKLDSDYDFFFKDEDSMNNFIKELEEYGAKKLKENDKNKMFIMPSDIEENEVEYFDNIYQPELKIQCINFQFFSDMEAVLNSFDFTICMFGYDGTNFFTGDYSLWDLAKKRLVVNKVTYAVSSMRRLLKYTKQGFTACGGCLTQILNEVVENPEIINSETQYID